MINMRALFENYAEGKKPMLRIEAKKISANEGELLIYGPIVDLPWFEDEVSAYQVRSQIDSMQLREGDTLHVRINSPGGFLDQGIAIHNTLKQQKAHVVGWVDGLSASSASIILAAADEIRMPKNARIMIHDPWTMTVGDAEDHLKSAQLLEDGKAQAIESYFARKLTASREEVAQMMTDETWLTAERAVELGFADVIVGEEAPAKALAWDLTPFNYRRAPMASVRNRKKPEEVSEMKNEDITVAWLRENRPEILDEVRASLGDEISNQARAEGAAAERERIRSVESAALPGHEAIIETAKWDGVSNGPDVAMRIVEAERQRRDQVMNAIRSGDGVPGVIDGTPDRKSVV